MPRTGCGGGEQQAYERHPEVASCDVAGGVDVACRIRRAPYAGVNRVRFQGTVSIPAPAPEYPWRNASSLATARRAGNVASFGRRRPIPSRSSVTARRATGRGRRSRSASRCRAAVRGTCRSARASRRSAAFPARGNARSRRTRSGQFDGRFLHELEYHEGVVPLIPTRGGRVREGMQAGRARRRARRRQSTKRYQTAQRIRKRVENVIGWSKVIGSMERCRHIARWKNNQRALTAGAAEKSGAHDAASFQGAVCPNGSLS